MNYLVPILALFLISHPVLAGEFHYSQIELHVVDSERNPSLGGDGFELGLTHDFNRLLLNLRVQKIDHDLAAGFSLYTEYHAVGVGSYVPLGDGSDLFGLVQVGKYDSGVNPTGPKIAGVKLVAFTVGIRHRVTRPLEARIFVGIQDYDRNVDDQAMLGGKLVYRYEESPDIGVSAAYEVYEDFEHLLLGVEFRY